MHAERTDLRSVADFSRALSHGRYDVRSLLGRVCDELSALFGFERVVVFRRLPDGALVVASEYGVADPERFRREVEAIGEWPLLRRACAEGVVVEPDVLASGAVPAELAVRFDLETVVAAPLQTAGGCIGFVVAEGGPPLDAGRAELLHALCAVTATLADQAAELDQSQRLGELKGQFVALASHELRTPVAAIYGIASTLHRLHDALSAEQHARLRESLYEQVDRMRLLVDQLLDLSRLEAGSIPIRVERFPVRHRVEQLVDVVAGDGAEDVEIDVEDGLETVVDPNAFDRIVTNLVVNAFRYGAAPITIKAEQRDTHFRLTVEDRGDGVASEFVPHLFERFTRSEPRRHDGGSGLGLAIAQTYANAHGGELVYEPAQPHGARFQLVLPRQHEPR